jgi:hypothetical protein
VSIAEKEQLTPDLPESWPKDQLQRRLRTDPMVELCYHVGVAPGMGAAGVMGCLAAIAKMQKQTHRETSSSGVLRVGEGPRMPAISLG